MQLHNDKTSLTEKSNLLQDVGSDAERLCYVYLRQAFTLKTKGISLNPPTSPLCDHSTVSKAAVTSSASLAEGLMSFTSRDVYLSFLLDLERRRNSSLLIGGKQKAPWMKSVIKQGKGRLLSSHCSMSFSSCRSITEQTSPHPPAPACEEHLPRVRCSTAPRQ